MDAGLEASNRKPLNRKYIFSSADPPYRHLSLVKALTYFGHKLRRLRHERRLTQEELAFRADLSVVYLRGLEHGRYNPTLNLLVDLGRALGIPPADLLRGMPRGATTRDADRKRPGPK